MIEQIDDRREHVRIRSSRQEPQGEIDLHLVAPGGKNADQCGVGLASEVFQSMGRRFRTVTGELLEQYRERFLRAEPTERSKEIDFAIDSSRLLQSASQSERAVGRCVLAELPPQVTALAFGEDCRALRGIDR